jgi:hypothetical protein
MGNFDQANFRLPESIGSMRILLTTVRKKKTISIKKLPRNLSLGVGRKRF